MEFWEERQSVPRVSIIVPNYNHAAYLDRRIGSVLNQTYRDTEVLLLDDASTDNSREIITRYESDPRVRVILNETNSGSVFEQWNRGMHEAQGEFIWIAESDDCADIRLVETLVGKLDEHPSAGIACCQTWLIDEEDNKLRVSEEDPRRLGGDRWKQDFFNGGHDECLQYLLFACTIINAGSALFRRSIAEQVGCADNNWRVSGDWVFYLKLMMVSDVVYVAKPYNYLRLHPGSVSNVSRKNGNMVEEAYRVMLWAMSRIDIDSKTMEDLRKFRFYGWICNSEDYGFSLPQNLAIYRTARKFDPRIASRIVRYLPIMPARRILRPLLHCIQGRRNDYG